MIRRRDADQPDQDAVVSDSPILRSAWRVKTLTIGLAKTLTFSEWPMSEAIPVAATRHHDEPSRWRSGGSQMLPPLQLPKLSGGHVAVDAAPLTGWVCALRSPCMSRTFATQKWVQAAFGPRG